MAYDTNTLTDNPNTLTDRQAVRHVMMKFMKDLSPEFVRDDNPDLQSCRYPELEDYEVWLDDTEYEVTIYQQKDKKTGKGTGYSRYAVKRVTESGTETIGKDVLHRLAWEFYNDATIPDDHVIKHECDNKRCCAKDCLSLGTQDENMQDASDKGRIRNQYGPQKIRRSSHDDIRAEYAKGGVTYQQLADKHGVSFQRIEQIMKPEKEALKNQKRKADRKAKSRDRYSIATGDKPMGKEHWQRFYETFKFLSEEKGWSRERCLVAINKKEGINFGDVISGTATLVRKGAEAAGDDKIAKAVMAFDPRDWDSSIRGFGLDAGDMDEFADDD